MTDCIFCKIIQGSIPCEKVYEDDQFLAFLDIKPATKGHMLIIPKDHSVDCTQMDPELGASFFRIVNRLIEAAKKGLGAKGCNLGSNIGAPSGQEVFHTHFHLIPRYDANELSHWPRQESSQAEQVIIAEKIIASQ